MSRKIVERTKAWLASHETLTTLLLCLGCFAILCTVFYFVIFSDFGASADFIYSQF